MPKQISVFAENRPGKVDRITGILEEAGVNIRAITIADAGDYGIIKILADKPEEGCRALTDRGVAATLKEVVALYLDDRPGGLHRAASVLSRRNINIEDAYGFTMYGSGKAVFVLQVKDVRTVESILSEAGFSILGDGELYRL